MLLQQEHTCQACFYLLPVRHDPPTKDWSGSGKYAAIHHCPAAGSWTSVSRSNLPLSIAHHQLPRGHPPSPSPATLLSLPPTSPSLSPNLLQRQRRCVLPPIRLKWLILGPAKIRYYIDTMSVRRKLTRKENPALLLAPPSFISSRYSSSCWTAGFHESLAQGQTDQKCRLMSTPKNFLPSIHNDCLRSRA